MQRANRGCPISKLTLGDFGSSYLSWSRLNSNNDLIETALENTLSRDGTPPNQMTAQFDMNSNRIINLGAPLDVSDGARLLDVENAVSAFSVLPSQPVGTQLVYLSQYTTLPLADAAATALGGTLVIDKNYTLTSNTTLNSPKILWLQVVTLGSFNLVCTGNGVLAPIRQIIDCSSSGRLTGSLQVPEVIAEWFGATSFSSLIQRAVDFVLQSVQTQTIRLTQASYTILAPVVISGNQHPNIVGRGLYGTTINFATTSEQFAFSVIGTEQFSGGSLRGVTIQDPTNPVSTTGLVGLCISGTVGFRFDIVVQVGRRGVVFSNGVSTYTEFCQGILQSTTNVQVGLEYRTAGNISFHGSGLLEGSVIDSDVAQGPGVLIGATCQPYASPLDVSFFSHGTGNGHCITNNSTAFVWFKGGLDIERLNSGTLDCANGNAVCLLGDVGYLGDQTKFSYNELFLCTSIADSKSGATIGVVKPINRFTTTTANSAVFQIGGPMSSAQYDVLVDVSGTSYHYLLRGTITTDESTGYSWTLQTTLLNTNGAGFGAPSVTPSGNNVTVAVAGGGASLVYAITFNQIGQGYNHHDN